MGKQPRSIPARFRLAADAGDKVAAHPLFATKTAVSITLTAKGGIVSADLKLPDEERLESLLLRMRPFLLDTEDAYLPRIMNLATRHLDDAELVHAIESGQVAYKEYRRQGMAKLMVNRQVITAERAARLWLYAAYYHRDLEKERWLGSADEILRAMLKHSFVTFIMNAANIAIWTASVLREAERRGVIREDPVIPATAHPIGSSPPPLPPRPAET